MKEKSCLKSEDTNQDTLFHFDVVDAIPFARANSEETEESAKSSIDVLCDIFTTTSIPDKGELLEPISVMKNCMYNNCITLDILNKNLDYFFLDKTNTAELETEKYNKFKALEDLDVLSDLLKRENLQRTSQGNFFK